MSNPAKPKNLAFAGLLGLGALLSARAVRPIVNKWAALHGASCPLIAASPDEDLDRWMNEGGCCAIAAHDPHTPTDQENDVA